MKNAIGTTMFWWGWCLLAMVTNVTVVKAGITLDHTTPHIAPERQ